mmetsp:Transcript_52791/g.171773  ORF Transcript_52791/g.171773 Transcript_52791/m.171773 type:complete len:299 (-) Transcript_52791:23-919(-)
MTTQEPETLPDQALHMHNGLLHHFSSEIVAALAMFGCRRIWLRSLLVTIQPPGPCHVMVHSFPDKRNTGLLFTSSLINSVHTPSRSSRPALQNPDNLNSDGLHSKTATSSTLSVLTILTLGNLTTSLNTVFIMDTMVQKGTPSTLSSRLARAAFNLKQCHACFAEHSKSLTCDAAKQPNNFSLISTGARFNFSSTIFSDSTSPCFTGKADAPCVRRNSSTNALQTWSIGESQPSQMAATSAQSGYMLITLYRALRANAASVGFPFNAFAHAIANCFPSSCCGIESCRSRLFTLYCLRL